MQTRNATLDMQPVPLFVLDLDRIVHVPSDTKYDGGDLITVSKTTWHKMTLSRLRRP